MKPTSIFLTRRSVSGIKIMQSLCFVAMAHRKACIVNSGKNNRTSGYLCIQLSNMSVEDFLWLLLS